MLLVCVSEQKSLVYGADVTPSFESMHELLDTLGARLMTLMNLMFCLCDARGYEVGQACLYLSRSRSRCDSELNGEACVDAVLV